MDGISDNVYCYCANIEIMFKAKFRSEVTCKTKFQNNLTLKVKCTFIEFSKEKHHYHEFALNILTLF